MSSDDTVVTRIAVDSLLKKVFPPLIKSELLSRESFRSRYGFNVDVKISFGNSGVSVSRSLFHAGVRAAFEHPEKKHVVKDQDGKNWRVEVVDAALGKVSVSRYNRSFQLADYWMLLGDANIRLSNFERVATDINLPATSRSNWKKKLEVGLINDDEVQNLHQDITETPVHVVGRIAAEIRRGQGSLEAMVPRSVRYFRRLAGECEQETDLQTFVHQSLRAHNSEMIAWNTVEGIKLALLLSAHSSISTNMDLDQVTSIELQSAFEELSKNGDRVSQIGAIELGLSVLDKYPQLEPLIEGMIEQIRDDDPESANSRFRLLSALFMLIEGEVSRTKTFSYSPPFWRRLATIAQASLVERTISSFPVEIESFAKWAYDNSDGQQFYLQTLCDLRIEPKWLPDFISPEQLKAEFVGRIANAAQQHREKITSQALINLALDKTQDGILHQVRFPQSFFPGPLEGATISEAQIPIDLANSIDEALSQETVDGQSFIGLVNSAFVFKLDARFAEQAVHALQRAKHYLKQGEERGNLFYLLSGLASVAAVTRSSQLANELRLLIRRMKTAAAVDIDVDDLFRIGMIAAASHPEIEDWCSYVGAYITELAYSDLSKEQAIQLNSRIRCLCHILPELWTTLGQAEAATAAASKI